MTYTPEPGMTAKQIDKEVQRQAALFEDNCVKGKVLNDNIRFSEFAVLWFADRKNDLRPRTYERYEGTTGRIYAHAIRSSDDEAAEKLEEIFTKKQNDIAV